MTNKKTITPFSLRAALTLLVAVMTFATARAQDESQWIIEKFNDGADCYITGYSGTKDGVTVLTIPTTIDGATVKKFKNFSLRSFTDLVTLNFYSDTQIEEMPSARLCHNFKNVNLLVKRNDDTYATYPNALPLSITTIPDHAFYSTALETLEIEGKANMNIGDYVFSAIENPCTIYYEGPNADVNHWNERMYKGSWRLQVCVQNGSATDEDYYMGWYGGTNLGSNNNIRWTRDKNFHMTITSDAWDIYPQDQVLYFIYLHNGTTVKSLYIEHVYRIWGEISGQEDYTTFQLFKDLETVEIASGLIRIGQRAFYNLSKLESITLPATLGIIESESFAGCENLRNLYFDGTLAQWNAVEKDYRWNYRVASDYREHWRCMLTYDANGHGSAPAAERVYSTTALTAPEAPTAQGYTFGGWYTDAACTQPFDFEGGVTDNTTLYAKWTPLQNTVTFDMGGHGTAVGAQTVMSGNVVSMPDTQFYSEGSIDYGIEGWYTDQACTQPHDFNTAVDHSFTLYAHWAEAGHYTLTVNGEGGTVTLTDGLGRNVQDGMMMPGLYTLTVTPASGYSFSGSFARLQGDMGEMAHTLGGTSTFFEQIDLTTHDVDITVTFSKLVEHKVFVTTSTDGHAKPGTFTLADRRGNTYTGEGETLAKVNDGTDLLWSSDDNLTLTVSKTCAITLVNNGVTSYIDASVSEYTFTPNGSIDIRLYFFSSEYTVVIFKENGEWAEADRLNSLFGAPIKDKNDIQDGKSHVVKLYGRTLYKDGSWNTLCLPFALKNIENTPLKGATVMQLDVTSNASGKYRTRFDEEKGELNLYFKEVKSFTDGVPYIEAGVPYIVKWDKPDGYDEDPRKFDILNPVFGGVFITNIDPQPVTSKDGKVSFIGYYDQIDLVANDKSVLFLGADNTLYWPSEDMNIYSCRAYFKLGDGASNVSSMRLGFGDGSATAVELPLMENGEGEMENEADAWYDLAGRRLTDRPATPGIYIHSGKKIVIK